MWSHFSMRPPYPPPHPCSHFCRPSPLTGSWYHTWTAPCLKTISVQSTFQRGSITELQTINFHVCLCCQINAKWLKSEAYPHLAQICFLFPTAYYSDQEHYCDLMSIVCAPGRHKLVNEMQWWGDCYFICHIVMAQQ